MFNGVKSLSMFWVIFGHQFSIRLQNDVNALSIPKKVTDFFYLFVTAAFFAVDVFFSVGGFLVAYSFLREKSKNPLKYPIAIVHRILRFWPSYITAILIYYGIFLHMGSGPFWHQVDKAGQVSECSRMWKSIFFVDNIVDNGERMCLGWGWYLQNDMQIFIVSVGYLFLYGKNKLAGKALMVMTIVLSLAYNIYEAQINDYVQVTHLADFAKWGLYFPNIYIKPWTRCPPYLMGLLFGIAYMEWKQAKPEQTHYL